jgi:inhibitor of cysteine peptidase
MVWVTAVVAVIVAMVYIAGLGLGNEVEVTAEDHGGKVTLREGHMLVVTLDSNPTTGYKWQVKEIDASIIEQVGQSEFEEDTAKLGSPGVEVFRFKAVGTERTHLKLIYSRPWENEKPEKEFELEVVVE